MQRTTLLWIGLALSNSVRPLEAQEPPPDSIVVKMVSPALVRLLDHEIASAAFGRAHVLKLDLPSSAGWSSIAAHLFTVTNGRAPSPQDSTYTSVSIRELKFAADTVIATLVKEWLGLCPGNRWITTGTDYELRILRVQGGWAQLSFLPGLTWDAFGCPDA